jgi:protocatechuate 3,4-dioxygenase beta subunit
VRRGLWLLIAIVTATGALGASASAGPDASSCRASVGDAFGPFGRGIPPIRSKTGTGHVLTGVVLSALGCKPIRGAQVQFWQSNRRGQYVRALSATVLTDRTGAFRYESPLPVSYEGREPHIHIRVIARDHEPLLARYVLAKGTRRGSMRLVLVPLQL